MYPARRWFCESGPFLLRSASSALCLCAFADKDPDQPQELAHNSLTAFRIVLLVGMNGCLPRCQTERQQALNVYFLIQTRFSVPLVGGKLITSVHR